MDVQIFRAINLGWRNPAFDLLFGGLSYSGLGVAAAIVALLLLIKKETRIFGVAIGVSAIMGGTVIAQTMKSKIPRDRPSNLTFAHVQESIYHSSFPSGHTATAFAIATAIAILFVRRGKPAYAVLSYVWALGVGLSRIYRGVHWPTDVFGGALAGIVGGCLTILIIDAIVKRQTN